MTFTIDDLKAAFEAGERYGADVTMSFEDGLPIKRPDFDKWLNKYKQKRMIIEIMKDDQQSGVYE